MSANRLESRLLARCLTRTILVSFFQVNLTFEDNEAFVGPVVYMSDMNACIWNSTSRPFFSYDFQDIEKVWSFMNMKDNFILRENGSEAIIDPDYYVQTTVEYINISLQDDIIVSH